MFLAADICFCLAWTGFFDLTGPLFTRATLC